MARVFVEQGRYVVVMWVDYRKVERGRIFFFREFPCGGVFELESLARQWARDRGLNLKY